MPFAHPKNLLVKTDRGVGKRETSLPSHPLKLIDKQNRLKAIKNVHFSILRYISATKANWHNTTIISIIIASSVKNNYNVIFSNIYWLKESESWK